MVKELEVVSPEEVLKVGFSGAAKIRSVLARACWSGRRFRGLIASGREIGWP